MRYVIREWWFGGTQRLEDDSMEGMPDPSQDDYELEEWPEAGRVCLAKGKAQQNLYRELHAGPFY